MGVETIRREPAEPHAAPPRPLLPTTSTECVNILAHYHRAEVARMAGWRDRIDRTTNWAITVVGAMLSVSLSTPTAHHGVVLFALRYGDPELLEDGAFEDDARVFDEREVRLRDFDREPGATFTYLYDFGDDWHHTVEIEKLLACDVPPKVAACIGGARARPPEDVGGVGGYERFLA